MKPFNLNDFKAGKKVVTRDGREVKQLTYFECDSNYPLLGVVSGKRYSWKISGHEFDENSKENVDLFHPDEEMKVVINGNGYNGVRASFFSDDKPCDFSNIPLGIYKLVKVD